MSHLSAAQAQRLATNEMSQMLYLIVTLTFYILVVTVALFVGDIGTVIDFVSAYCISCMAFLIPGVFYRKAVVKFKHDSSDPTVKKRMLLAGFFIPLGMLNFGLSATSGILGITGVTNGGEGH